jgi:hypothetical protein
MQITGNGYSYSVPSSLDLRTFEDADEIGGLAIPGRTGLVVNKRAISKGVNLTCVLSGYLAGTDATDLADKFKEFTEVINSSPEPLMISTGTRTHPYPSKEGTIRVRKQNLTVERIASGGRIVRLSVTFVSEDGCWQDSLPVEANLGTFSGYPYAVLSSVTVLGSLDTFPTIIWRMSGEIKDPVVCWYGRNLVRNGSFDNGTYDWSVEGDARCEKYASKNVARVAENHSLAQGYIPCIGDTVYYFSAYIASDTASTARMTVWWYNSDGGFLGANNIDLATATSLVRISDDIMSPATAAFCQVILKSTVAGVFVFFTDVQVEESVSLSEYMPDQHVSFEISGDTKFGLLVEVVRILS